MLLQVTVPDGLFAGDTMSVSYDGVEFTLSVPDGVGGGDTIDVDLPVDESRYSASASRRASREEGVPMSPATVIVPENCFAGDEFVVDLHGCQFSVGVPDGCGPGDAIIVDLPAPQGGGSLPDPALPPKQLVGRRVSLSGLIAKALLNGRKGEVRSYNEAKDMLAVTVDGMHPDVSVKCENVTVLPPGDQPDPDNDEPPEAPPAGVHYVGDRVLVERSNGATSLATVVEYDEVFESYVLDLGNGVLKYGVEESYITPYETSLEWAGPPTRAVDGAWEGFFVGRRVRIPSMLPNADDDDMNGEVIGYDPGTRFYHVQLDSGVLRRTVLFKNIKVVYQLFED